MLMMTMLMRMLVMVMVICWVGEDKKNPAAFQKRSDKISKPQAHKKGIFTVMQLESLGPMWLVLINIPVNQRIAKTVVNFLSVIIRYHWKIPGKVQEKRHLFFVCFPLFGLISTQKMGVSSTVAMISNLLSAQSCSSWRSSPLMHRFFAHLCTWLDVWMNGLFRSPRLFFSKLVILQSTRFFSARNTQDSH